MKRSKQTKLMEKKSYIFCIGIYILPIIARSGTEKFLIPSQLVGNMPDRQTNEFITYICMGTTLD